MSIRLSWLTLVLAVGSACAGCAADEEPLPSSIPASTSAVAEDWGPLAVWHDPGTGDSDFALLAGTVAIDDECVTVEGYVVAWPATFTRWIRDEGTIEFLDPRTRTLVAIADGDRVALGGGEATPALPWIAPPDATCPANLWGAGGVSSVNGVSP